MPGIPEGILPPKSAAKSGTEPPAGIQGAGTIDQPYDQGNQPEQAAGPGIEPPAGQTGKGTPDQPYDQGNQPENTPTIAEPAESAAGPSSSTTESQEPEHPQRGRSASKIDNSKLTAHPRYNDREVSPGQLDDGTHVQTSGLRGQSYTPSSNVGSKIKGIFSSHK